MQNDEIGLKELIYRVKDWVNYLKKKWGIIFLAALIGSTFGILYAYRHKTLYVATLSFALEGEKSSSGMMGAMGLASSLGIDLGASGGSAFSGANLVELMQSRTLVEKALLTPIAVNGKQKSLATYFIEFNHLEYAGNRDQKDIFPLLSDRSKFSLFQDSVLGDLYEMVNSMVSVSTKDKKVSILEIDVKSINELFSMTFAESLAKVVSDFYIETKSKKARTNVTILQKQVDSIRNELNLAIAGVAVATDNTYNVNPAYNVKKIPSTKKQVDVQANTSILTQLAANLEMAKLTLLNETPLIQIIDKPIFPLKKERMSKTKGAIAGGFMSAFVIICILCIRRMFRKILAK